MTTKFFDSHFHIIDPKHPLVENNGYMPDPFTAQDYLDRMAELSSNVDFRLGGGAIVSGSFQAFDQGYLREALEALGPDFVGVTQIPGDVTDDEIKSLNDARIRAVRFNLRRGGSAGLESLTDLARRVYDIAGWHTELYVDSRELPELEETLLALPAISIDHLGMHHEGLPSLLRLVEGGVKVKATGFGRVELDPVEVINQILDIDTNALMVGTDVPSTRAKRPFADEDLELIRQTILAQRGEDIVEDVFWNNAARFYLEKA